MKTESISIFESRCRRKHVTSSFLGTRALCLPPSSTCRLRPYRWTSTHVYITIRISRIYKFSWKMLTSLVFSINLFVRLIKQFFSKELSKNIGECFVSIFLNAIGMAKQFLQWPIF